MGQPTDYDLGSYGRELMRKRYPSEVDRLRAVLTELSQCDGSPDNVASAEILAARVRSVASSALAE